MAHLFKFGPEFANLNVKLILFVMFFNYLSRGIYNQNILSAYIFMLPGGSNTKIGLLTGLQGSVQVLLGPCCGYLADKYRRDALIRAAAVMGIIAPTIMLIAVWAENYLLLCIAGLSWGLFQAMSNSPVEALFADSVPCGSRSKMFSVKMSMLNAASAAGPALSAAFFLLLGDQWAPQECRWALTAGLGLSLVPPALLFFVDDGRALGGGGGPPPPAAEGGGGGDGGGGAGEARGNKSKVHSSDLQEPLLGEREKGERDATPELSDSAGSDKSMLSFVQAQQAPADDDEESGPSSSVLLAGSIQEKIAPALVEEAKNNHHAVGDKYSNYVPGMMVAGDIISGIASGMSIKFFPIFFMQNLRLLPVAVQIIYTFSALGTSAAAILSQRLSRVVGRGAAILICKSIGISILVSICLLVQYGIQNAILLAVMFVVRTAFMNGPKALSRSIIMDQVPKRHRAKWSSLESFNTASWSGSAFLGGVLVDRAGILNNFFITSFLQTCALVPIGILSLTNQIPRESATRKN